MADLKRQASPFTEQMESMKEEQAEQLEVVIALLRTQNKNAVKKIELLKKIKDLKEAQALNDCLWRNKWSKQKNISIGLSVGIAFFTITAFYLNVIKLDEQSAVAQGVSHLINVIGSWF